MTNKDRLLTEKYPEVMNSGIEVRMWYCETHKEYFSNNCSECMLLANDPDTIAKTRQQTLQEVTSKLTKIFNEKDSVELENYIQDLRNQSGVMPKE